MSAALSWWMTASAISNIPTSSPPGVSVAVAPPAPCPAGCSAPKTGYISEVMAKFAAQNIVASVEGKPLPPKSSEELDANCLIDAGNQGIIMLTDRV